MATETLKKQRELHISKVMVVFALALVIFSGSLGAFLFKKRQEAIMEEILSGHFKLLGEVYASKILEPVVNKNRDAIRAFANRLHLESPVIRDIRVISFPSEELLFAQLPPSGRKETREFERANSELKYIKTNIYVSTDFGLIATEKRKKVGELWISFPKVLVPGELLRHSQTTFIRLLLREIESSLERGDIVHIRDSFDLMVNGPGQLMYTQVMRSDGTVLIGSARKGLPANTVAKEGDKETYHQAFLPLVDDGKTEIRVHKRMVGNQEIEEIGVPLLIEGQRNAVVRLGYDTQLIDNSYQSIVIKTFLIVLLNAIVILIVVVLLALRISRPLEELTRAVEAYEKGEKVDFIKVKTGIFEIIKLKEKLATLFGGIKELNIAATFQRDILPDEHIIHGKTEIAFKFLPMKELSGDLVSIIPQPGGGLAIALGDVSGKGARAGTFMVLLSGLLESELTEPGTPAQIVRRIHQKLLPRSQRLNMYSTLLLGFMDPQGKQFRFTNAGHPYLLQYHSKSRNWERVGGTGTPLGLQNELSIDDNFRKLESGDFLLLFSDGLVESRGASGNSLQWRGLDSLLNSITPTSSKELVEKIESAFVEFLGNTPVSDDVVIMAIRPIE